MTPMQAILDVIPVDDDWTLDKIEGSDLEVLVYTPPEGENTWVSTLCITHSEHNEGYQIDVPTRVVFDEDSIGEAVILLRDVWMLPFGFYGYIDPTNKCLCLRMNVTILNPKAEKTPQDITKLLMDYCGVFRMRVDGFCSVFASVGRTHSASGVFDILEDLARMPDAEGTA